MWGIPVLTERALPRPMVEPPPTVTYLVSNEITGEGKTYKTVCVCSFDLDQRFQRDLFRSMHHGIGAAVRMSSRCHTR